MSYILELGAKNFKFLLKAIKMILGNEKPPLFLFGRLFSGDAFNP